MSSAASPAPSGFVVWIEGLPGAGKSTLARALSERLDALGRPSEILDGERVRQMFFPELGFSRKDRETHARRVSELARILAGHGVAVVVAMITPYETSRQVARAAFGARFAEVWLNCPLSVCEQRDPRGVYKRRQAGEVARLTGIDDPFEEPLNPDLTLATDRLPPAECTERILTHLADRGFVRAVPA